MARAENILKSQLREFLFLEKNRIFWILVVNVIIQGKIMPSNLKISQAFFINNYYLQLAYHVIPADGKKIGDADARNFSG